MIMKKLIFYNPTNGEVIGEIEKTSIKRISALVKNSKDAQIKWANLSILERISYFTKLKNELIKSKRELSELIKTEQGKPLVEAKIEIDDCIETINYYSKNAENFLRDEDIDANNKKVYQPLGVVAVISPWNYPFSTPFWAIIPALISGNSIIFKPSEEVPYTGLKIKELFNKAGFPKGVFEVIFGDKNESEELVKSDIDMVSFTGSVETGKSIMKNSSRKLHKVSLELGGKDPAIVCEDADLGLASEGIVWGAFSNSGQVCTSVERVFVHESVYDKFVSLIIEETRKLQPEKDFGPVINKKLMNKIESHIKDAKDKKAKIIFGGKRQGNFYLPTILTNVTNNMKIMQEETFGPVLPIMTFKDLYEAIKLANSTKYGLGASVWTKDEKKGISIAKQIQSGIVWINDVNIPYHNCPWGGVKYSGFGKVLSKEGLLEFVNIKHINFGNDSKRDWWYPYE